MAEAESPEPWKELVRHTDAGRQKELQSYLDSLSTSQVILAVSRLSDEDQTRVLTLLSAEQAADLVEQLPDVQAVELIEQLEPQAAAAILDRLPSDEQADLIGDLEDRVATAIIDQMAPAEAADVRVLSNYADDVAGGLMVTEFVQFPEDITVEGVVEDLRQHADEYRDYDIQYAYVCDRGGRLTGVLRLRDLLLANRSQPIAEIMISEPLSVRDDLILDELADLFQRFHYLGVPVVDEDARLIGVVRKAAVDEAWRDRHGSEFLKTQGIVGGEEIRTMPLLRRSRRRLSWLSVNILLNIMAASVIAIYQQTLSEVIALAIFLPIISDMSGCSGNQSVAVSLRELALGLIEPIDVLRVWFLEVWVGVLNGGALGVIIGLVAYFWLGNPYFGLVVGIALCLNTIVAVSLGSVIPLLLRRIKMDPALASGPILTTITDMCGFFFLLGIATLLLSRIVG